MKISDVMKNAVKGKRRTLYLDMDGVIVNFMKQFELITGQHPDSLPDNDDFWRVFRNHADGFFENAPAFDGYKEFIEQLYDIAEEYDMDFEILTAIPRKASAPNAEREKKSWVKAHDIDLKVNIGPYAVNKQNWCRQNKDVLIDDSTKNIEQWNAKGGIGILHTDFSKSLKELRQRLEQ